jgi:DNA-binding response OmpR family regulator
MARIIMIAGDLEQPSSLVSGLEERGHNVVRATCTEYEMQAIGEAQPDLVVVDFSRMGAKAAYACQRVMARTEMNCCVLTTFAPVKDEPLLAVFVEMADDLAKKHATPKIRATRGDYSFMTVDVQRREVIVRGKRITLTPTETHILSILASNAGQYITPRNLVTQVYGYDVTNQEAADIIRVHIHNLRRKFDHAELGPPYIVSSRGRGYMLERRAPAGTARAAE